MYEVKWNTVYKLKGPLMLKKKSNSEALFICCNKAFKSHLTDYYALHISS